MELTLLSTGETAGFDLDSIGPRKGVWIDFVAATAWALQDAGHPASGFRGVLTGDLPIASGLSSSAALELAAAWALVGDMTPDLDRLELARIAQRAENEYVGVQCGLMDQFAVACGERGSALLLDCRTNEWNPVAIPNGLRLVVCHTGSDRVLAASDYNNRLAECRRAVAAIQQMDSHIRSLRDVDESMLNRLDGRLDDIAMARTRHVVTENRRVAEAAEALRDGDFDSLGRLFAASHASLRDDYQVSSPELDFLVQIATGVPGVVAARMTGAGFGGCTINLVTGDSAEQLRASVMTDYASRTGRTPRVWEVEAVDGVSRLTGTT